MRLFTDSATGTLLSDIAIDATTIFLDAGQGVNFPDPQNYPAEWALLTLENAIGQKEKILLTARTGDQLTVIRAQEGTSAVAFLAGTRCELRVTATALRGFLQKDQGDILDSQAGGGTHLQLKRYSVSGDGPVAGDLYEGEIAVNLVDKWIWAGGIGSSPGNSVEPIVLSNGPNGALTLVTQANHGLKVGQPLYWDGVELQLAMADDIQTCGRYVVKQVVDADTFLMTTNGNVFPVVPAEVGLTSIVAGQVYYVSDNIAGRYEAAPEDIDPANWRNPLVVGVNSNTLLVTTHAPYQSPTHNELRNRTAADCHPTSSITGLDTALGGKFDKVGGTVTGPVAIVPASPNETALIFKAPTQPTGGQPLAYASIVDTGLLTWATYWSYQVQCGNLEVRPAVFGKTFIDYGVKLSANSEEGSIWVNSKRAAGAKIISDMTYDGLNPTVGTNPGLRSSLTLDSGADYSIWRWYKDGQLCMQQGNTSIKFGDVDEDVGATISITGGPMTYSAVATGSAALQFWKTIVGAVTTTRQTFQADGTVLNYNNVYGQISARAGKSNITDATPKLADLCALRVRNFTRKDDPEQCKMIGLVAEEVTSVFPGLVKSVEVPDGPESTKQEKMIAYSLLVPMLIKAMQEQQEQIEELRALVDPA